MNTMTKCMGLAALVLVTATGCQEGDLDGMQWGDPNGGAGAGGPGSGDGTTNTQSDNGPAATCSTLARKYKGFGGTTLPANPAEPGAVLAWTREDAIAGVDRLRYKPYSALTGEYPRVTGVAAPQLLGASSTTFGTPAARWSTEPQASAVNIYTAFRVSFETCLQYTATDTKYAAAPVDPAASTECGAMARKFWSRTATADEVKACAQVAMVDSATEVNPQTNTTTNTDPRRRWAYACASVLSSAGFMTY